MKLAAIVPAALICTQFVLAQVPYERLRNADQEPGSWLTYSGAYHGQRFSKLDQISTENVSDLRPVWVYQVEGSGEIETTPLAADGVMYVTELEARVTALDVRTGRPLWTHQHAMPEDVLNIGFGRTNRGGALLGETFYFGTLDAHLVALDAKSGALRWKTKVAENKLGYSITAAPLAIDGKIIVGVSGGEAGIRGFLDAYDAETGERAWRSYTIPGPGEPGNDTWGSDSWKTGAGATWLTGSYDPELDLLYWGTGNPGPDWNGDSRPGDNLYTCSLLAIEAPTGKLRWHFQFTPHDVHDWDSNQIPVLIDMPLAGKQRKIVAFANRNAFYYLLDRETGEFLSGTEYSTQTWAKGIDKTGRPILAPGKEPTVDGNLVYPSLQGATNWMSPSYSPVTKLLYVPVREMGSYYFKGEAKYEPGKVFVGGGERRLDGDKAWGSVRALRADSGERVWDFRTPSPLWTGVMATAGGLVFGGSNEGNFYALDASTGKPLWDFQTGGIIRSNPISFLVDGKQYVATSGGRAYYVFALP